MATTQAESQTIKEVFVLGLSSQEVDKLLRAMAAAQSPAPAPAHLEIIDLSDRAELAPRGPFAMPAVAA